MAKGQALRWVRVALAAALAGVPAAAAEAASRPAAHATAATGERTGAEVPGGRWRLQYDTWLGGMLMLTADVELEVADGRYAIRTSGETRGLASLIYSWRGAARSAGVIRDGAPVPDVHHNSALRGGERRRAWIEFGGDGAVRFDVSPPPDPEERDPVPPRLARETVDPLTALVAAGIRGALSGDGAAAACRGRERLFDGKRRYDARLVPGEEAVLERAEFAVFHGRARRCEVEVERIAGFWKTDEPDRQYVENPRLWIARVDGLPYVVPVRMEGDTMLGGLVVHLSKVTPVAEDSDRVENR